MDLAYLGYLIDVAMGFALGGVLMSGHFLFTGRPLGFSFQPGNRALVPLQILLRLAAGPAILMRNVFTMQDDSVSLMIAGVLTAALWGLGCGALDKLMATV